MSRIPVVVNPIAGGGRLVPALAQPALHQARPAGLDLDALGVRGGVAQHDDAQSLRRRGRPLPVAVAPRVDLLARAARTAASPASTCSTRAVTPHSSS